MPDSETFSDVPAHRWSYNYLENLSRRGIISGLGDGKFRPEDKITRIEFIVMINKALGLEKIGDMDFADVPKSVWYYDDVAKAVGEGYIKGVGDNKFAPDSPITRQDAATAIGRAFRIKESEKGANFSDFNTIRVYALGFVNAAAEKGFINGYPDGTFKPFNTLSREEAATIIFKIITD